MLLLQFRQNIHDLMESSELDEILDQGAEKANAVAYKMLKKMEKRWD